jgi:UDP-N-acetylglucosamine acyltransferase
VIDSTARVADGARIEEGVEIGPYCIVGPQVELGAGVRLVAHVHLAGVTAIGAGTVVYPFASLGTPPQSVHYRGGATRLVVGPHCEVREGVTMNTGTEDGGGLTSVGERCMFMAGSHVGHDCQVGDSVIFANNAVIGGHVSIGSHTFLGGNAAVHQYARVGEGAMVAGLSGITRDLIPFGYARGQIASLAGLNIIGLRRRGATRPELHRALRIYRKLFLDDGLFADRVNDVVRDFADDPVAEKILAFIRAGGKLSLMQPRRLREGDESDDDAA